jgi:hypothetical protein
MYGGFARVMQMPESVSCLRRGVERRRRAPVLSRRFWFGGRRRGARRAGDCARVYVDVYDGRLFSLLLALMVATSVDAALTLHLLSKGATEANPLLAVLLRRGVDEFLWAKLAMTAGAVLWLTVHNQRRLLRRIPVRAVLSGLLYVYAGVIGYELMLLVRVAQA